MNTVFFAIYLIIILLIIEISTILLESTGLRREVARFQAISLLTNTGYTTTESEMIINHPVRRKIASFLIVFGTISFAVILSFVISFFVSNVVHLSDLGVGILILAVSWLFLRSKGIKLFLSRNVGNTFDKYYVHHKSVEEVFHVDSDYVMRQFRLTESHVKVINFPLKELKLADEDIKILNIKRNSHIIKNPTGSTLLLPGDVILVYGNAENIRKYFIIRNNK
ncbi:TrkA C-terminal domain-containing protein [Aneurinibacillus sp. Ricciae_BoGa-3]|uniref:TrkA C-terminal domain-containing protein n=1 Tax=Aneurinibacillus sp. Ricciae_BoGa-3 TaxID=3022697 RepID=UPI0023407D9B|nr:TrkA C-terminal domain-containing protein [Aneurinibacillus sp. Ricciae_BoGa-3]WCK52470.1 TrkA C-terminal domain-containing protein [Aneurinibacillus sp. Ricciae_BoGa-3]